MQSLNKKTIIFISVIIILITGIYYVFIKDKDYIETGFDSNILNTYEENSENNSTNTQEDDITNKIVVYVAGAVKNEGIYKLDENSRIADSIEKAGGLTEDANINNINLAYVLEDGMKVYIPKNSDNMNEIEDKTDTYVTKENGNTSISTSTNTTTSTANSKININTATQTELETLPGIGPAIALKIISYREENGKFASIEDIKKVSGIGDSKYSQIKDLIKV